jgi:hypothetical protein
MLKKYSQRTIIRAGFVIALTGILLLLLLVGSTSSVLFFIPGLLLIGFGAGSMLTVSVNLVQSSVPENDQGALSGVSRSVSNLGSSMGTAIAGAVLISALVSGVSTLANESDVLAPSDKDQIATALQGDVSAMSDEQVRTALEGQPQPVVDEVTRINADARDRALGLALVAVAAIGLLGLVAAIFLPRDVVEGSNSGAAPS